MSSGGVGQPPVLVYPELLLATTICLYRVLRLVIAGGDHDSIFTVLSSLERYQFAVDICRSMPYYLKKVPCFLVSELMFSLGAAFVTFLEGRNESELTQQMFGYI